MVSPLAAVDPVAIALAELAACPALPSAAHLSGLNEPPYPHVVVRGGGGDGTGTSSRLVWTLAEEVTVEVWAALDGQPGSQAVRALLVECCWWLCRAPDRAYTPGRPVVVDVTTRAPRPGVDAGTKQLKWSATLRILAHPDNS